MTKATIVQLGEGDDVTYEVVEPPAWHQVDEFGGVRGLGNFEAVLHETPNGRALFHRIPAGRSFPLHTGDDYAYCFVVSGRGVVELPGGKSVEFSGPCLFAFEPGTLHGWRDIVEDTLLAISIVKAERE